jgi:Icc-related predicted phosphoesterase
VIVDCISDLHGSFPKLKGGDLLIVAGDLTANDEKKQYAKFYEWYLEQPYRKKIVIAGNHDRKIQNWDYHVNREWLGYLQDSGTEFEGLKIWGSPWTARCEGMNPHCMAFTCNSEEELFKKWAQIPDDTDILVTHSPAWGLFDGQGKERYGSKSLQKWVSNHRESIKLHVHGHIHESYGIYDVRQVQKKSGDPLFAVVVNASHMTIDHRPENKPIRVIL